jgi:hypothetical protein
MHHGLSIRAWADADVIALDRSNEGHGHSRLGLFSVQSRITLWTFVGTTSSPLPAAVKPPSREQLVRGNVMPARYQAHRHTRFESFLHDPNLLGRRPTPPALDRLNKRTALLHNPAHWLRKLKNLSRRSILIGLNSPALADLARHWIDCVHARRPPRCASVLREGRERRIFIQVQDSSGNPY